MPVVGFGVTIVSVMGVGVAAVPVCVFSALSSLKMLRHIEPCLVDTG